MSYLNHMWLSEHTNEYNSVNLYKYIWIHPKSHCFLLSGWMLLVTAALPLHNTTWGVWLAASGPFNTASDYDLSLDKQQDIICTNGDQVYWHIYVSLGLDESILTDIMNVVINLIIKFSP